MRGGLCYDVQNMNTKQLEKIVKGFANHRRIQIMELLDHRPNASVFEISDELGANFKTVSEHTRRLAHANLVVKKYVGKAMQHSLSPLGRAILKFLRTLE